MSRDVFGIYCIGCLYESEKKPQGDGEFSQNLMAPNFRAACEVARLLVQMNLVRSFF